MPGYYPNNSNFNQYYGASQMPMSQPQQNGIMAVPVDGEASMRAYPVGSGNTVMLIDFNSNKFWLKSTDTTGMPQQLRTFEFKELIQQPAQSPAAGVTREEFNSLSDKLDKLIAELGGNK